MIKRNDNEKKAINNHTQRNEEIESLDYLEHVADQQDIICACAITWNKCQTTLSRENVPLL